MTQKPSALLIQIASDHRIPKNAMGYVADLGSKTLSDSVRRDRLKQLSRYVPELVKEPEASSQ